MPFDGRLKSAELFGVGVAPGLATEFLAFFDEGLLQGNPDLLGRLHDLGPGNLQESAINRVGNCFLLDGAINNDPLEFGRSDGFDRHGGIDGGLEQFFDAGFANGGTETTDLGGIAR